ncbi:MAG: histidine kinase [Bacteroidota bacterium]|nr:histidine kinase [Bacteroidota bacterium]
MRNLIILIFIPFTLKSQTPSPYCYPLNVGDNTLSNTIYSIIQNKEGAIFIGHENGVTRYNGKTTYNYLIKGKGKAISNLVEANDGTIWCRSFYGDIFLLKNDSAISHPYSNSSKKAIPSIWLCNKKIVVVEKNKLFVSTTNDKLVQLNFTKKSNATLYAIQQNKKEQLITAFPNNKLQLIVLNDTTVKRTILTEFSLKNNTYFLSILNRILLFSSENATFYEYKNNRVFISDFKLDVDLTATKITGVNTINDSLFGISTFNGYYIFNNRGKLQFHLLKGLQISSVLMDKEDNLWLGTLQDGVFIFPSLSILDNDLKTILQDKEKISTVINLDDSSYVVGTFLGRLLKFNQHHQLKQTLDLPKKSEIQCLHYNHYTKKLIGYSDGLFVINIPKFKLEKTLSISSTKDIYSINTDLYIASSNGFICVKKNDSLKSILRNTWINELAALHDTLLFVATRNGLFSYSLLTEKCIKIVLPKQNPNEGVRSIKTNKKGDIYILLTNNHLLFKNKNNDYLKIATLPNANKLKLNQDTLIIITTNGIHFFNTKSAKFFYDLNESKAFVSKNFIDFLPFGKSYLKINQQSIQQFKSFLKSNSVKPILKVKRVKGTFSSDDEQWVSDFSKNNLSFEIEVYPNIKSKGTIKLYYKLEGLDEYFKLYDDPINNFKFTYQLLPHGNYTFSCYAVNEDGLKSNPLSIKFTIKTPFWKTWWFNLILIVTGIYTLYLLYVWRIKLIRQKDLKKMEDEQKKVALLSAQLTAIRSQMNPHFIFNSLSSIQSKVLSQDRTGAYKDISTFSKLMRSVLNHSSKEFIKLNEEIDFLKDYLYLESVRTDGKINYQLNIDETLDINFLEIPTLITQPFVENAIKHGLLHKTSDKNLSITFRKQQQGFSISILDNGIGREKSSEINKHINPQHQSFASEAIKKRIKHINEGLKMKINFEIIDHPTGTEVKLNFII